MPKPKILIIDDEKKYRDVLQKGLEAESFEVVIAANGEEGLEMVSSSKPDLIICDMIMPKKDGFEVLKGVRQEGGPNTPLIMLTAVDDFAEIKKAYSYEADCYVTKPVLYGKLFEVTNLMKNVKVLLNLSQRRIS